MTESILELSRDFFFEIIKPIMEREFPLEASQTAFGLFGYGSEAYGLERADIGANMAGEYSADHHWGVRINALMPDYLFRGRQDEIDSLLDAMAARSLDLDDEHTPGRMVLASPFMHHYIFEALRSQGRDEVVIEIIRRR